MHIFPKTRFFVTLSPAFTQISSISPHHIKFEVCGQAQKSVNWKSKKNKEFLEHLLRREIKKVKTATCSRFEKGTKDDLVGILDLVHNRIPIDFKIFIVQPSISKATVTEQQLTLLGVTENYLMDRALINLNIIGSV